MAETLQRPLKVFLCHASDDKSAVRALYQRLVRDGVDAWLDKAKLLPGQDWQLEIPKAVKESDVVVVCLSKHSITKEGYVQKEIKITLDAASEKPEGTIFLIPARLEDCDVPSQLGLWQWVDLFESDGYEWLMRSLRLRADKIGANLENPSYVDEGLTQKIDHLYTDGLAAFWVEDWERACYCFQTILRYVPNDTQVSSKLEEAERQKRLSALYLKALEAQKSEDWNMTVETLEKLTSELPEYKDASLLLKEAQKKNRLTRLYEEARKLHKAEQWQAVVRVFEHIASIEPAYQDPEELLPSAENKVAELKRLNELNTLYARAVREMDSGHWGEAYELFKQIRDADPAFRDTERLMAKVEVEVKKTQERQEREYKINTLYEQARALFRSRMWRESLSKIDEIRKLNEQFADPDQLAQRAQVELEHQRQEIERHDKLTAMYGEAVSLLREKKYQGALEKWQEIVKIDPGYPDQQKVQVTSKNKLAELTKNLQHRPHIEKLRQNKLVLAGSLASLLVITLIVCVLLGTQISPLLAGLLNSPTPSTVAASADQRPTSSPAPSTITVTRSPRPTNSPIPTPLAAPRCPQTESVFVRFDGGYNAARTVYNYSGTVLMRVSGTGRASGTAYTDAFYAFTDGDGNARSSPEDIGFNLMINNQPAKELIADGQVPSYNENHVYSFEINVPGGRLTLGVDDAGTVDNTGGYGVKLCQR